MINSLHSSSFAPTVTKVLRPVRPLRIRSLISVTQSHNTTQHELEKEANLHQSLRSTVYEYTADNCHSTANRQQGAKAVNHHAIDTLLPKE